MAFFRVWILGFLVALVLPVLIHLFWRRRVTGRVFPMAWLLPQTKMQRKRFRTLRSPWLLGIRFLAFALLILAFALPVPREFQEKVRVSPHFVSSPEQYVLLVDVSPSVYSGEPPTPADQFLTLLEKLVVHRPVEVQTCSGRFWLWSPQQVYALLGEPMWQPCRLHHLLLAVEPDVLPVILSDFQSAFLDGVVVPRRQIWVVPQGERENVLRLQVLRMDRMQTEQGDSLIAQVQVTCTQCAEGDHVAEIRLQARRQVIARYPLHSGNQPYTLITIGATLQGTALTGTIEGQGAVIDPYPLDNTWYWSVIRRAKTHIVWTHAQQRYPLPNSLFDRVRQRFPEVAATILSIHPVHEFLLALKRVCPDVLWLEGWDRLTPDDQNAILTWLDTATACVPVQSFFFMATGGGQAQDTGTGMVYLDMHAPVWRALLPAVHQVRWLPLSASCSGCQGLANMPGSSSLQAVWTPIVYQSARQSIPLWVTQVWQAGSERRTRHWIGIVPVGEGLSLWRHPPVAALLLYSLFLHSRWWVLAGVPGGVLPEIPGLPDSLMVVVGSDRVLHIRQRRIPAVPPGFYTLRISGKETSQKNMQMHVLAVNLHPDERSPFLTSDSLSRRAREWQAEIQPITSFAQGVLGGGSFPAWYRWFLAGALLFFVIEMLYVGGWLTVSRGHPKRLSV